MRIPLLSMDDTSKSGEPALAHFMSDIYGSGGGLNNSFCKGQGKLASKDQKVNNALSTNLRLPNKPMISPRSLRMEKSSPPLLLPRPTSMNKNAISRLPNSLHAAKKLEFKDSSTSAFFTPKSNAIGHQSHPSTLSPTPSVVISECSGTLSSVLSTNPIGYHIEESDRRWENISPMTTNIVSPLPSPRVTTEFERAKLCTPVSEQLSSSETVFESVDSQSRNTLYHTPLQCLSDAPSLFDSISKDSHSEKSKQAERKQVCSFIRSRSSSRFPPPKSFSATVRKNRCIDLKTTSRNDLIAAATITPVPQNLKGDPHRQAKVKTELCKFYIQGCKCPFGSRCNYAHGEIFMLICEFNIIQTLTEEILLFGQRNG